MEMDIWVFLEPALLVEVFEVTWSSRFDQATTESVFTNQEWNQRG